MRGPLFFLILGAATAVEAQQQGSVQLSTDSQIIQGHALRRLGERPFEPDFGALWTQPGRRFSQFQLEVRGSRRGDELHLGRTWFALRDARAKGVLWTFEGGDLYTPPSVSDYQFSNLSSPAITFTGGAVRAKSKSSSLQLVAGRSTAWRNIFGTDPDALGQSLGLARASYQATSRLQLTARGSRVRTTNLKEFTRTIDASDQGGGGFKLSVTPSLQLVGDGAYVRYRATGSSTVVNDYSYLTGVHLLIARGWVQVNASRYSPGDLPVLNASLRDRSGIFSAGEYDLFGRVRVFGGWEQLDTNIQPTGTALDQPMAKTTRQFGGFRLRLASRSTFSARIEDGGRVSRPASTSAPLAGLFNSTSDTGSITAELQSSLGRVTAFGRYTRREAVDSAFSTASYTQHDSAAQLYVNLSQRTQLFGVATLTHNRILDGAGNSYLQVSAGGQQQLFQRGLWLRVEGSTSRMQDLTSGLLVPREALSVGLNGQLSQHTIIGFNVYADRAPAGLPTDAPAWLTRSTVRIVHSIPTGSVRVDNAPGGATRAARGTGTVSGSVFADWNANGRPDAGEEVLEGIPVALGTISAVTTGRDGQFSFLNVPSGAQNVRLDLNALPLDFDAPLVPDVTLELARGESRRVTFGLLPLGAIRGRVVEDTNKNGQLDPGEPPVDGAVIVLDGGQRSELARKGQFRFDSVRAGEHTIELLKDSLPEGSTIAGATERPAPITKEAPQTEVLFLVTIEKRPEVRRVFPARGGGGSAAASPSSPSGRAGGAPSGRSGGAASSPSSKPAARTPSRPISRGAPPAGPSVGRQPGVGRGTATLGRYTVQVAALTNAANAKTLVADLKRLGFDAYLIEPAPGGADLLHRVRVGRYLSPAAAQRAASRLEDHLGLKMWVTRSQPR